MTHTRLVILAAFLSCPALAAAQSMLLELRLVPQSGTLPAPIADRPLAPVSITPTDLTTEARTRRFELQYRLIDLRPDDGLLPAGLSAAVIDIRGAAFGGPASDLTLSPSLLSRHEAQLASAVPPGPTDSSGLPTGVWIGTRGLHRPFRGGIPSPAPNNGNPANGTTSGLNISQITALVLAAPDQGNPDADPTFEHAWYGLYSFELTAGPSFAGYITFTATATADPVTGNRFGYFTSGDVIPITSAAAVDANATVFVINIPAPSAAGVLVLPLMVGGGGRRRRQ